MSTSPIVRVLPEREKHTVQQRDANVADLSVLANSDPSLVSVLVGEQLIESVVHLLDSDLQIHQLF